MTLEDLVMNYLFPRKAARDGEVWVKCPFCGDEKYRMGINVHSGLAHCFRGSCEWKTNDRRHLFRELCRVLNVADERIDDARHIKKKKDEPKRPIKYLPLPNEFELLSCTNTKKLSTLLNTGMDEIEYKALHYLLDRGLTSEQIRKHKLGFCASGEFAWRIIIPVFKKGKLVSYTGRDFSELPDTDPKYKNSEGQKYLYNLPKVKKSKVILVEGPFDVFSVERANVSGFDVIGRLGSGLVKSSMRELLDYDEITLWPDPDKAGVDLIISTAGSLIARGRKISIVMPKEDDIDPGKLGETEEGLQEIVEKIKGRVEWTEAVRTRLHYFAAFA